MSYDPKNIFARILKKELPANIVYEDENCLAFHDVYPRAPVHILVITKKPYISFNDFSLQASPQEITQFFQTVAKIAEQMNLSKAGYRLVTNHGAMGGQEVPHFHVHILGGRQLGPIIETQ